MARRWQPITPPQFRGDVVAFCNETARFCAALQQQLDTRSRISDAPSKNSYTIENGTVRVTLHVGTSTLAETQEFIATMCQDLKTKGVLR